MNGTRQHSTASTFVIFHSFCTATGPSMSAISDVTVTTTWTQVYSASGTVTVVLENRANDQDILVHVSQTLVPTGDAPALVLRRYLEQRDAHIRSIALASGDEVYVKLVNSAGSARMTLFTP
jgi:hypothetical protein